MDLGDLEEERDREAIVDDVWEHLLIKLDQTAEGAHLPGDPFEARL